MVTREIKALHNDLIPLCNKFMSACKSAGFNVLITCTYRSQDEQNKLFAQGRTAPGQIVTWTKISKHSFFKNGVPASKAFDIVLMHNNQCVWNVKASYNDNEIPDYEEIAQIGRDCGLGPGADFKNKDYPHFELIE